MNPFPLTDAQVAAWLGRYPAMELGNVNPCHYREFDLDAPDPERLGRSWRRVVERHEALRCVVVGDGRVRILAAVHGYEIPVEDLRPLTGTALDNRLAAIRAELTGGVPDPTMWPPFALRLSRLPTGQLRLHLRVDQLVADADSVDVLAADLAAFCRGEEPEPLRTSLPAALTGTGSAPGAREPAAGVDRALGHWRTIAAELPPAPQLPLVAEPPGEGNRFTRSRYLLTVEAWRALSGQARERGLTPTAVLLAAYATVLAAWSREHDFTVAYLRPDRPPLPGIGDVVGNFTALVPVAVHADPRRCLADLAADLTRELDRAWANRQAGGPGIVRAYARAAGRDPAGALPVAFSCRLAEPRQPATGWAAGAALCQTPQAVLVHDVTIHEDRVELVWDAAAGLLPEGMLDDLVAAHADLLDDLAHRPSTWDGTGRTLLPDRQRQVRTRVNDTVVPVPPVLLHHLFWDQAARTPERVAIAWEQGQLSYGDVRAAAGNLSDRLHALGARPNELVAIVMDKGWQQPVAALAIHDSGAGYVPVEPDLPPERFRYLLDHAQVRVALTQPHLAGALPWPDHVHRVVVDESVLTGDGRPARAAQTPQDLAYVIYTSGSTGLPKGVMISHRSAATTILDINRRFRVGPDDRMLTLTPLSFDLSVYDLFGPFAVGGALVMPEPDTGRAPWHWADLMEQHAVTLWNSVPALMEMLVGYTAGRRQQLSPALRLVLMSGDWIPVSLPDRIRALAAPGIELVSLGGATEASIWSIVHRIGEVDTTRPSIPYGTPLSNQYFEILDDALLPRPDWVPGEQYVGGSGVAIGYWRDEEKTARAFITHPRTGRRLYRTGDLGRYHPDGSIEFLGRDDFQVKIHGYRIELGEIEATLLSHPHITAAVVTAIGDPRGEKRLAAYVTTGPATPATDDDTLVKAVREHVANKLPAYMVPSFVVVLDAMPLTRNGKLDRKALPAPRPAPAARSAPPPGDDGLTARLVRLWREVLGTGTVPVTERLDTLGATSLHAAQVHHRLAQDRPGVSLDDVLRHPTIAALVAHLDATG